MLARAIIHLVLFGMQNYKVKLGQRVQRQDYCDSDATDCQRVDSIGSVYIEGY